MYLILNLTSCSFPGIVKPIIKSETGGPARQISILRIQSDANLAARRISHDVDHIIYRYGA